ncbi:MAG TPA: S8 family serine peptidase [Bacteroidota bacterium]|nr:S8 family serine peptidase [Bacteroidota bacterium]
MRQSTAIIAVMVLLTASASLAGVKQGTSIVKHLPLEGVAGVVMKDRNNSLYFPDRIIVKLMPRSTTSLSKSMFGIESIDRVLSQAMGVIYAQTFTAATPPQKPGDVDLSLFYTVVFTSPNDPFTLAQQLSQLPEVQYAEPWFISRLAGGTFVPNDSLYAFQWHLRKVNAPSAWDITQGDSTIVVAIVDSGVELDHPDLQPNIWINKGETGLDAQGHDKRTNNIDDDGDGYVDDWHGWDLVGAQYQTFDPSQITGDNDPSPTGINNDHGTHVAGIVAAATNNLIGVASLAAKCRILAVKTTADNDTRGSGDAYVLAGYQGIVYAVTMGAKIINCSWGAAGGAQTEQDIIDYATQHGALVVAAAGNESSGEFFSPADYRGALSVASTDANDKLSWYSNFGINIDVCAPGENITSTLYPHTYGNLSGTSMASPLAASVAALVKWKNPSFTGVQIGEQVRVTCDNIDAVNSSYVGLIGRGRVNAYNALTVNTLPSVRLISYSINDSPGGNGNGVPQPAETLNVVCNFRNYLAPTSGSAVVRMTSDSPYLVVTKGTFSIPSLGTLDSASNKSAPFRVYVQQGVPPSFQGHLQLTFTDGDFSDAQSISLLVNPTFATQNVNDIQLTLTNNGRLGFYDFPDNSEGVGFVFHGVNHLFEGGLMIGTSATKVVDVVRTVTGDQDADLVSNGFFSLATPGIRSDQDGSTSFSDSGAVSSNRLGVQIAMHSYAYSDPSDSKFVILQYDITNTGATSLTNLYAGIFLDWDIGNTSGEVGANYSRYDASRSLGYAFSGMDGGRREYLGIRALDSAASFRSLVNSANIDLSRAAKWDWMTGGFAAASAGPADIHQAISSGPYTIAAGGTKRVSFALVAGDSSLANIQQNADAAKQRWRQLTTGVTGDGASVPIQFGLSQNYPNPFNPATTIRYQLASASDVSLRIYDVLGREVARLVDGVRPEGFYTLRWDASTYPSGIYFYRLDASAVDRKSEFHDTRKMVLVK